MNVLYEQKEQISNFMHPVQKTANHNNLYNRSFREIIKHSRDNIQCGFDYREQVLMKTTSSLLWKDEKKANFLLMIERVVDFLIDHVKVIKKTYNWRMNNNYRDFN